MKKKESKPTTQPATSDDNEMKKKMTVSVNLKEKYSLKKNTVFPVRLSQQLTQPMLVHRQVHTSDYAASGN